MTYSFAAMVLLAAASLGADGSPFAFRETSPTALELSDGGKPVFVYNFGMVLPSGFPAEMKRSSYLHPVYAPDGTLLTDDFNPDHPHHRGISWMWPEVTVDGKKGDIWTVQAFRQKFVGWKARETTATEARLAIENGWFDGEKKFVKEDVEIVAHAAKEGRRVLDFTLSFEAIDKPVEIVGTSEGKKGFGGFCFRFAPRDGGAAKTVISTDQGVAKKDGVLARHPWAEVSGTFKGHAAGGRVEDLPQNPGYPKNGWLLRHGFGFLNVSYPGLKPLVLEPGKPLTLQYRVTLFAGESPAAPPKTAMAAPKTAVAPTTSSAPSSAGEKPYPFFPFCIDWHDSKKRGFAEQAAMLKELGYDGVGHIWLDKVDERLKTLDAAGLKLYQITMSVDIAAKQAYDPRFKEVLALVKGRHVQFDLLVGGMKPSDPAGDEQAVKILREMSDLAKDSGAQLLLYPHVQSWIERIEDSVRVADKVDRANVGVMFNLCHWLRVDKSRDYKPLLEKAMPRLWGISLNGADSHDDRPDWEHYIQPLDRGDFDMAGFLKTLKALGYRGPIGLQCYGIGGDTREHLIRSMDAWKKLRENLKD